MRCHSNVKLSSSVSDSRWEHPEHQRLLKLVKVIAWCSLQVWKTKVACQACGWCSQSQCKRSTSPVMYFDGFCQYPAVFLLESDLRLSCTKCQYERRFYDYHKSPASSLCNIASLYESGSPRFVLHRLNKEYTLSSTLDISNCWSLAIELSLNPKLGMISLCHVYIP